MLMGSDLQIFRCCFRSSVTVSNLSGPGFSKMIATTVASSEARSHGTPSLLSTCLSVRAYICYVSSLNLVISV
jgi:hypothetical protein